MQTYFLMILIYDDMCVLLNSFITVSCNMTQQNYHSKTSLFYNNNDKELMLMW
jgi:hypothetical protein